MVHHLFFETIGPQWIAGFENTSVCVCNKAFVDAEGEKYIPEFPFYAFLYLLFTKTLVYSMVYKPLKMVYNTGTPIQRFGGDIMAYGDGSIYKRNDGKWVAKYTVRPGVKPKYFYGKSESEVKRKLRAYKQSPEIAAQATPTKMQLKEYMLSWLRVFKRPTVKSSTYDRIESVINGTIVPQIGDLDIGSITSLDYQKFINGLMDEGKSYWVIKKAYDTLNDCLDHAVKNGDLSTNPMATVGAPSKANFDQADTRALTQEEETALLAELDRKFVSSGREVYNYKYAYILLLNTGMRLGEVVALDWDDVDFDAKTISVSKNAVMVRDRDKDGSPTGGQTQVIQPTPKTKSSNRTIPLNAKAIDALKNLKEFAGDSQCVINTSNHTRPLCGALLKQINVAYKKCGIHDAGIHTLRHTFATRLFERGAQVKDVSVILGHSSVGITANTYIHVIEDRKQDVVNLLD